MPTADLLFLFSIELEGVKPPVKRRFIVPISLTFSQFHEVVQDVMGWTNSHLYEFVGKDISIGPVDDGYDDPFLDGPSHDADEFLIGDFFHRRKMTIRYIYDFGDNWQHKIKLEDLLHEAPAPATQPIFCLEGSRACPPEDIGGIYGYEDFLKALAKPNSKKSREILDWIGATSDSGQPFFDPEHFDIDRVNKKLARLCQRLPKKKEPEKSPLRIVNVKADGKGSRKGGGKRTKPSGADSYAAAQRFVAGIQSAPPHDFPAELAAFADAHPDFAAAFGKIIAHGPDEDAAPAFTSLFTFCSPECFPPKQCAKNAEKIASALRDVITDASVDDRRKITALGILGAIGHPFPEHEREKHLPNYQKALEREFADITDAPRNIAALLEVSSPGKGAQTDRPDPAAIRKTGEFGIQLLHSDNPAGAAHIAASLAALAGMGALKKGDEAALGELGKHPSPQALWCLLTLAEWPWPKQFRDRARSEAVGMEQSGVRPQAPDPRDEFSHGFVTMTDGMGTRTVGVLRKTAGGGGSRRGGHGVNGICAMLNDTVGVKDALGMFGDGEELERMYTTSPDIVHANAQLETIRAVLADSLALHRRLNTSPPGTLFALLPVFGGGLLLPVERTPDLSAYSLEKIVPGPELVVGSESLVKHRIFSILLPDSDEAYAFCRKHGSESGHELPAAAFDAFVREVASREREALLRRMAVNLEVEALAGRAGKKINKQGAKLLVGLRENVVPFEETPFVRALSRQAVKMILTDLRNGFFNRGEKFDAEMRMDDEMFDFISQIMGGETGPGLLNDGASREGGFFGRLFGKLLGSPDNSDKPTRRKKR